MRSTKDLRILLWTIDRGSFGFKATIIGTGCMSETVSEEDNTPLELVDEKGR